jgi:hypothetical protein
MPAKLMNALWHFECWAEFAALCGLRDASREDLDPIYFAITTTKGLLCLNISELWELQD